jgi:hypothetical protein
MLADLENPHPYHFEIVRCSRGNAAFANTHMWARATKVQSRLSLVIGCCANAALESMYRI